MKPPTRCPNCKGDDLKIVFNEKFSGEWMYLCADCLYHEAYGEHAVVDARRIAKKLGPHILVIDAAEREKN